LHPISIPKWDSCMFSAMFYFCQSLTRFLLKIVSYFQLCCCNEPYSAHSSTPALAGSERSDPPPNGSSQPTSQHNGPPQGFFHSLPPRTIPSYTSTAPVTSLVTPYTSSSTSASARTFTQGHTAFGVPMSGVSMPMYNARGRIRSSGAVRPIRQRAAGNSSTLNVLIILLPKDVSSQNASLLLG
jgi:hypothetical protein